MTVNSWGGNPITRYNYVLGNAFNHGSDYEFRNTSYGNPPSPLAQQSVLAQQAAGIESRLAIPTLGWIAKNADDDTCSFPDGDACLPQSVVGDCRNQQRVADPTTTSIESTPEMVRAWLDRDGRRRRPSRVRGDGQRARSLGQHALRRPPRVPDVRGDPREVPRLRHGRAGRDAGRRPARARPLLLVRLLEHRPRAVRGRGRGRLHRLVPRRRAGPRRAGRRAHAGLPRRALLPADRGVQRRRRRGDRGAPAAQHPVAVRTRATATSPGSTPTSPSSRACARRSPSTTRAPSCSSRSGTSAPRRR